MHVYFYDIENKLPLGNATQVQHLSDLLNMSDVVSLHVPENASTKNLMGAREIALMKPGALPDQRRTRYGCRYSCAV